VCVSVAHAYVLCLIVSIVSRYCLYIFNDNFLVLLLLFSLSLSAQTPAFPSFDLNAHGLKYCGTHDDDEEEEEDVGEGLIHSGGSVHRCGWRPFASPSGLRNFHRLESTPSSRSARSAKSFKSRMISEAVVVVVVEAP